MGVGVRHVRKVLQPIGSNESYGTGRRARAFAVTSLPQEAQAEWARGQNVVPIQAAGAPGQMGLSLMVPTGPNLSAEDRAEVDRRYRILEPLLKPESFRAVWAENKGSKVAVIDWLAKHYETRRRTVYNWLEAWNKEGLAGLVPRDRKDKGKPRTITSAALEFLMACAFPKHGAYGKLSVREIYRSYLDERAWRAAHAGLKLDDWHREKYARYCTAEGILAPSAQLPEISYSSARDWFNRIPEIAKVMARDGDEAFHNTQEILSFRDLEAVKPMDYVVMDHRRLDLFCMVRTSNGKGWSLVRPWLTAAIDMRTRKWLAWCVVETPSSDSIAVCLRRVFIDHGLPSSVYWDNGKDFRCEWLEGGRESAPRQEQRRMGELDAGFRGVLGTLGIRVHHAIVKRARSKIIEPNFGRTSLFDRSTPWWCGNNSINRPAERVDRLLDQHERWLAGANVEPAFPTIEQIAEIYGRHMEELNERPMEGAEGMRKVQPAGRGVGWMSPNDAWGRLAGGVEKRIVPEEILHLCFRKRREIKIRNGEVRVSFGGRQFHYRMANPMRLMAFNGAAVELAYDPLDLESGAVYFEGQLVGIVECIELRRMGEDAFVEDEKNRRTARREVKSFITNVHRAVYVPDVVERQLRRVAVTPARTEPERRALPAALPAAISETVEEIAAIAAEPEVVVETVAGAPIAADDEFNFFN